jgi:hypothetical protein
MLPISRLGRHALNCRALLAGFGHYFTEFDFLLLCRGVKLWPPVQCRVHLSGIKRPDRGNDRQRCQFLLEHCARLSTCLTGCGPYDPVRKSWGLGARGDSPLESISPFLPYYSISNRINVNPHSLQRDLD